MVDSRLRRSLDNRVNESCQHLRPYSHSYGLRGKIENYLFKNFCLIKLENIKIVIKLAVKLGGQAKNILTPTTSATRIYD